MALTSNGIFVGASQPESGTRLTGQNWVHQWGHFTGDPKTGDLYFRRLSSNKIYRWEYKPYPWSTLDTSGNDSWPEYATGGWPDGIPNALSIAWHPDLNGGDGGMVHFNTKGNDADIWASNDAALTSWSQLASDIFPAIDPLVEGLCTYLPGQKWVMFGGGTQDPWRTISYALGKVEADGTVTKLNDVPFVIGANSGGKIVGHPNGRVFGVDFQNQNLYEYSEGGDSWSTAGLAALPFTSYWSTPVMIPEFNCIYVAAQETSGGDSAVQEWIYKL